MIRSGPSAITIAVLLLVGCSPEPDDKCFLAALHSPAEKRIYTETSGNDAQASIKIAEYAKTVKDPCMRQGFERVAASEAGLANDESQDAMKIAVAERDGAPYK